MSLLGAFPFKPPQTLTGDPAFSLLSYNYVGALMAILQLAKLSWGLLQKTIPQRQFRNSGTFIKENQVNGVLRVQA